MALGSELALPMASPLVLETRGPTYCPCEGSALQKSMLSFGSRMSGEHVEHRVW